MTLNELNKNSKFGYRRKAWDSGNDYYIAFVNGDWVHEYGGETTIELFLMNLKATDWYLTTIPNKYYKRVAVVTKDYTLNFPKGTRIIQSDDWHPDYNRWVKADYSDNESTFRTPGIDCVWEDEMGQEESPFPCFRTRKWSNYIVMFTAENVGEVVHGSDVFNVGHSSSNWVNYNDSIWEPCEDPRKLKFKVGDVIRLSDDEDLTEYTITSVTKDRYYLGYNGVFTRFINEDKYELVTSSCSSEPTIQTTQKENTMDLRLLLAMMAAMSDEETKDATNSQYVVIVTKDDEYEGYFYSDNLDEVEEIVAKPSNELKKFHVFDYSTTLSQKPRKVVEVKR